MPGDVNRDCAIRCLLDGAHFIFDAQLTLVELDEGSIETLVHAELLVRIVRMDERDTKVRIPIFGRGRASKRQRNEVRPLRNIGPTIGHAVVKRSQFCQIRMRRAPAEPAIRLWPRSACRKRMRPGRPSKRRSGRNRQRAESEDQKASMVSAQSVSRTCARPRFIAY